MGKCGATEFKRVGVGSGRVHLATIWIPTVGPLHHYACEYVSHRKCFRGNLKIIS